MVRQEEIVSLSIRFPAPARWPSWVQKSLRALVAAATILAAGANVVHYVDWQSQPRTRQDRYLYVTVREFPDWAADVVHRATAGLNISNVGGWRDAHPIQDIANP